MGCGLFCEAQAPKAIFWRTCSEAFSSPKPVKVSAIKMIKHRDLVLRVLIMGFGPVLIVFSFTLINQAKLILLLKIRKFTIPIRKVILYIE